MLGAWFSKKVFGDDHAKASPLTWVRAGLPPLMVIQGSVDNLVRREQANAFTDAVRAAGNEHVVHLEISGAGHAFDVFHSIRGEAVGAGIHRFLDSVARAQAASTSSIGGLSPASFDAKP